MVGASSFWWFATLFLAVGARVNIGRYRATSIAARSCPANDSIINGAVEQDAENDSRYMGHVTIWERAFDGDNGTDGIGTNACAGRMTSYPYDVKNTMRLFSGGTMTVLFSETTISKLNTGFSVQIWAITYGSFDVSFNLKDKTNTSETISCLPLCVSFGQDAVIATDSQGNTVSGVGAIFKKNVLYVLTIAHDGFKIEYTFGNGTYGIGTRSENSFGAELSLAMLNQTIEKFLEVRIKAVDCCKNAGNSPMMSLTSLEIDKTCDIQRCTACNTVKGCDICQDGFVPSDGGTWCKAEKCTLTNTTVSWAKCTRCSAISTEKACAYNDECMWCAAEGACRYSSGECYDSCATIDDVSACTSAAKCSWQANWSDSTNGGYCVELSEYVACKSLSPVNSSICESSGAPCAWCGNGDNPMCLQSDHECSICLLVNTTEACSRYVDNGCTWCQSLEECFMLGLGGTTECTCSDTTTVKEQCGLVPYVGCGWCDSSYACVDKTTAITENCSCSSRTNAQCATGGGTCIVCESTLQCAPRPDCVPCAAFTDETNCSERLGCVYYGGSTCMAISSSLCDLPSSKMACDSFPKDLCAWCSGKCTTKASCSSGNGNALTTRIAASVAASVVAVVVMVSVAIGLIIARSRRRKRMYGAMALSDSSAKTTTRFIPDGVELAEAASRAGCPTLFGHIGALLDPKSSHSEHASGITIRPVRLDFGSGVRGDGKRDGIPVDARSTLEFVVKNTGSGIVFVSLIPTVARPAARCCKLETSTPHGTTGICMQQGESLTCELAITPTCSMCDLNSLAVVCVAARGGFDGEQCALAVPVSVTTGPSWKLDARDIELGAEIGKGAFGTVYKGTFRRCTDVAVKRVATRDAVGNAYGDADREMQAMINLRSKYLVALYGVVPEDIVSSVPGSGSGGGNDPCSGMALFVMEYAPLGSLAKMASANPSTPIAYGLQLAIALDVACGLRALHVAGYVHRDIKPDNVLLFSLEESADVRAKITDFGTARSVANADEAMRLTKGVGTPLFMAPEILKSDKYSFPADTYSFAITMWCMHERSEPFSDLKTVCLWNAIVSGKRPKKFDGPFGDLVADCWSGDPAARPSDEVIIGKLETIKESARLANGFLK